MSLRVVKYKPQHLYDIRCRVEQVANWSELITEGIAELLEDTNSAQTLLDGDKIICIAGYIEDGQGGVEVYTFLSGEFKNHLKFIVQWLKEELDMVQLNSDYEHISSMGLASWPFLPRWMKTLGFLPVCLVAGHGRYGEDYILYRRKPWLK